MDVSRSMVRCRDRVFLSPDASWIRQMGNPDFVEMICAVHALQFGEAYVPFLREKLEAYVYIETCRECVLEALHRYRWVSVAYPVGCTRGHLHGLGWIDGENNQDQLMLTPEQRDRYAQGVGEECPPWFRNGGRGKIDAYWKRLIF